MFFTILRLSVLNFSDLLRANCPRAAISRVVTLGVAEINRRYAVCLWRESLKLTTRRMTPEAKALVIETQERVKVTAGI